MSFCFYFRKKRYVHVRSVASVVGQLISISMVIGSVSQIMTRYLSIDILKARTWNSYIKLSEESADQLMFWKKTLHSTNSRHFTEVHKTSEIMVSDASNTGFGGYEVNTVNGVVHGVWTQEESTRYCQSLFYSVYVSLLGEHDRSRLVSREHIIMLLFFSIVSGKLYLYDVYDLFLFYFTDTLIGI